MAARASLDGSVGAVRGQGHPLLVPRGTPFVPSRKRRPSDAASLVAMASPLRSASLLHPARAPGLELVRLATALIVAVHPLHGLWSGGDWGADVTGFGAFLSSQGLPLGVLLAWGTILLQLAAVVALLVRRLVVPACLALLLVLGAGVVLIHAHEGWFVVGAGRNGMEFSVLLMACLAGILVAHAPRGRPGP